MHIRSPYHLPAEIEVKPLNDDVVFLGEVMLRRPLSQDQACMVVSLVDAEKNPISDWMFAYGPITFGGPYGKTVKLNDSGQAMIEDLAPQQFQIGFTQRMQAKWRSFVDLKSGKKTVVTYQQDKNGQLSTPEVIYEER